MRATLLALAVAVAGCAPPDPARVIPGFAVSDSTISFLEPDVGGCRWRVVDPTVGMDLVLATLPDPCEQQEITWRRDGGQAVFLTNAATEGPQPFLVDAGSGAVTRLPRLPGGYAGFGWNDAGELVMSCTIEIRPSLLRRMRGWLTSHPVPDDDTSKSYRLDGGRWRPIDVDGAVTALTSDDIVHAGLDLPRQWRPSRADAKALPAPGHWMGLGDPRGRWYVRVTGGEPMGPLYRRDAGGRLGAVDPDGNRLIDLQVHGAYALESVSGTGERARLFEADEGLVFSSDLVHDAVLWPRPSGDVCPDRPGSCDCDPFSPGCEDTLRNRRRYEFIDP